MFAVNEYSEQRLYSISDEAVVFRYRVMVYQKDSGG